MRVDPARSCLSWVSYDACRANDQTPFASVPPGARATAQRGTLLSLSGARIGAICRHSEPMAAKDISAADPLRFLADLTWADVPDPVRHQIKRCLFDTLGVAAGGYGTRLSAIIRDHAAEDMPGPVPILLDNRTASRSAAAMAGGMMIDSLDGHDGYNPAKGHIGCPLLPALLAIAPQGTTGEEFLTAMVIGYEIGGRVAVAQHATCPDYHTSGSWGAVAVAAAGSRLLGLDPEQTRHALGIAEYHGPRSQMMRCIDFPTMLKDGSGWGALCGVSALQLAARGFTGAPAITVENAPAYFATLGTQWITLDQYFKPYPVCRWAQSPVEGVLALRRAHDLTAADVAKITVETFHESCRLATATPKTTEEAQYSTSFPCAVAMVHGALTPADIADDALSDPEVLRLSQALEMREHSHAQENFPAERLSRVALTLTDGRELQGDWMNPLWAPDAPPADAELETKFTALAAPVLGADRASAILTACKTLESLVLSDLTSLLYRAP
jgi:2-methylcitrate dehydratase PrpD